MPIIPTAYPVLQLRSAYARYSIFTLLEKSWTYQICLYTKIYLCRSDLSTIRNEWMPSNSCYKEFFQTFKKTKICVAGLLSEYLGQRES